MTTAASASDRARPVHPLAAYAVSPLAALVLAMRLLIRRPMLVAAGAMLLVCVPETTNDVSASVHVTAIDLGTVLIVAATLPVLPRALAGRTSAILPRAAGWLLGAVVLALTVATAASTDPVGSLSGYVRYMQLFVLVPAAVAVAVRTSSRRDTVLLLYAAVAVGIVEAAIGTWQEITVTGASYGGTNVRAVGTFGALDVMGMATVVGFGMIAALVLALTVRDRRARLLWWAAVAAMTPGMVFSLSRGAWIATAAAVIPLALLIAGRAAIKAAVVLLAAGIVAAGIGLVPGSTVISRFGSLGSVATAPDQSVIDRYSLWAAAEGIWRDHPVTGVGLKQFPAFRDSYAPVSLSAGGQAADPTHPFQVEPLLSPHNLYLLTLSEQGLPGGLAFAALLVGMPMVALGRLARRSRRTRHGAAGPDERARLLPLAVAAGWGIWAAVDFLYGDVGGATSPYFAILLGLILAVALPDPRPVRVDADVAVARPRRGFRLGALMRGSLLTAGFSLAGSGFGLARDLLLARFFGAAASTDAFLVSWTVPETAAPLLIEDGMSFLMVPVFARAAGSRRATRRAVAETWLPLTAAVSALAALTSAFAPQLVRIIAPGLADPGLAVRCTRLTAITVVMFGLAGYVAALLRSHHVFGPPASIYVVYNIGILALMIGAYRTLGVTAVAAGVALGAVLMVAVQTPAFLRAAGPPMLPMRGHGSVALAALAPVVVFTVSRQAQVYVERYLGSKLPPGAISHLNYSQKVAQVPMQLGVLFAAVSFPTLSRAVQAGRLAEARRRMARDLAMAGGFVALSTLLLLAVAPEIVRVLFQHGAFTARDTAATASIMRVYALGLVGQTVVGVTARLHFSARATWLPAAAMVPGLLATAVIGRLTLNSLGANGIALGNAAGITLTAILLLATARRALDPRAMGERS